MVVGSGDKIMAGRGWWQQHFGWPGVVVGGGNRIMADRGWSWMVALLLRYKKMNKRIEFCVTLFQFNHHSLTTKNFWTLSKKIVFLSNVALNLLDMSNVRPLFRTLPTMSCIG